jgi:hypothetical protein
VYELREWIISGNLLPIKFNLVGVISTHICKLSETEK